MSVKEEHQNEPSAFNGAPDGEADKIDRIAGHTFGLVDDLKAWFELKIEYMLLDIKEEAKTAGLQYAFQAGAMLTFAIATLFGLVALALAVGAWLNQPSLGFLLVAVLLGIGAIAVRQVGKWLTRKETPPKTYVHDVQDEQKKLAQKKPPALTTDHHG